jgi:hypothetical protein
MDFLPSELPRDASNHFSNKLFNYVVELAANDPSTPFEELDLNPDIKNGIMTCHGKLTPNFEYIAELRRKNEENAKEEQVENKTVSEIIGKIVEDCPELVSDIRNAAYYQEMCPESKDAILRIAKLLRG